jgi:hypothetical protein
MQGAFGSIATFLSSLEISVHESLANPKNGGHANLLFVCSFPRATNTKMKGTKDEAYPY